MEQSTVTPFIKVSLGKACKLIELLGLGTTYTKNSIVMEVRDIDDHVVGYCDETGYFMAFALLSHDTTGVIA
jgi:hypothetical protein